VEHAQPERVLTSPRWAGLREYKGAVVGKAGWPAIIRKDVHERLRLLLLDRGRANGGTTARKYLLPGFIYCEVCSDRLVSRPRRKGGKGENVRSYTCIADHPGARVSIIAAPLEDLVRDEVFDALDTPRLSKAIRAQAGHDEEQRITLDAIRDDEAALEQLARDHFVDRVISRSEFISARKAIEDRIESARRRLARVERRGVVASLPNGRAALEKA
jgi:site-specific DNA recombinase